MRSYGLVLLAAGPSDRMGQPKQLLPYRGMTLIEYMLQTALSSVCEQVVVVLGAHAERILPHVQNKNVLVVQNNDWKEGMASSIRHGLSALTSQSSSLAGVVFMVCDQPFVSSSLIDDLIRKKEARDKPIVACTYELTLGTPALFDSIYFPELMLLSGQEGAKKILMRHSEILATIPFPMGYIDIDTMQDYEGLSNSANIAG